MSRALGKLKKMKRQLERTQGHRILTSVPCRGDDPEKDRRDFLAANPGFPEDKLIQIVLRVDREGEDDVA